MINKYQLGGLTYQPFIKSIISSKQVLPQKESFVSSVDNSESFPVEPVREWVQPENFDWKTTIEESKPDNYVGEKVSNVGKVYKDSEREEFKSDLLNAYIAELKKRGFDEKHAEEYAKRIVAQDALESKYGQSSLVKYFNFGGIKDFRENSDSLKVDTKEFENGKMKVKTQPFRKFKNLEEYVNYKLDLLGNENYDVFSYSPDVLYARLTSAKRKYATDPDYEKKLNGVYWLLWNR